MIHVTTFEMISDILSDIVTCQKCPHMAHGTWVVMGPIVHIVKIHCCESETESPLRTGPALRGLSVSVLPYRVYSPFSELVCP